MMGVRVGPLVLMIETLTLKLSTELSFPPALGFILQELRNAMMEEKRVNICPDREDP